MRLETEEGPAIEEPTDEQIREALAGLGGESGTFAILTRQDAPCEYVQTGGEENAFVVEYHENDRQYRATDDALPLDKTAALFQAYNRGDERWREMVRWEDVTHEIKGRPWIKIAIIAAALAVSAVILYLSFTKH